MRHEAVKKEQAIINKINAMTEFTYPSDARISDSEPTLLHRSSNPSINYTAVYADVYKVVADNDSVLVGVRHLNGLYDVLKYKK